MSLRHRGPIGAHRLSDFAIDRLFHFPKEEIKNRQACNCKVCGDRIKKGDGTETYIKDARYFLCGECTERVEEAKALFDPKTGRCVHCERDLIPMEGGGWTATEGANRALCADNPAHPGLAVAHVLAEPAFPPEARPQEPAPQPS